MIRIYLVEDHHIVREGIKSVLEVHPSFRVVGESPTAEDLLDRLSSLQIDLVISDISLEGMDGIELTKKIKEKSKSSIKVLIMSMHADEQYIKKCLEAGADGYLLKDFKNFELTGAIEKVMRGEKFISRSASQVLAENMLSTEYAGGRSQKVEMTKREMEIIELISHGLNNKEIAEKIFVSTSTVDAHRYNILKKLEVKNTAEMITKAIKMKLLLLK
jgi:DNA-binding NarL/FixJ family response regulator